MTGRRASSGPGIAFRVDASPRIGSGHLMRSLALAAELERSGRPVLFVCRHPSDRDRGRIGDAGFRLRSLPEYPFVTKGTDGPPHREWLGAEAQTDVAETLAAIGSSDVGIEWIVVDHYGIDAGWEREMRGRGFRLLVVDDLADRAHDCDILLDQTCGRDPDDYRELVGPDCRMLVGSDYAVLREEFARLRPGALARRENGRLRRVLVALGGYDPANVTGHILRELEPELGPETEVDVLLGADAPHADSVARICDESADRMRLTLDASDMGLRMMRADLAFGAGGTISWERCCLALPAVVTTFAGNQARITEGLVARGAIQFVGDWTTASEHPGCFRRAFVGLRDDDEERCRMARNASRVVDGLGARRVADILLGEEAA